MTQAIEKRKEQAFEVFGAHFEQAQRVGKALASSPFVPEALRDVGSCMIAIDLANRVGAAPLAVMQNMYVVHGRPAFEAKFVISCINACGKFSRLKFKDNGKQGDDYGVYAEAEELSTGEVLTGTVITWRMVKAEGWDQNSKTRSGATIKSKWNTMSEQMFKYRAASFWSKEHAPELTMGIPTRDEMADVVADAEVVSRKAGGPVTLDDIAEENKREAAVSINKPGEFSEYKKEVIDAAVELWGDEAMIELAKLMRERKSSISDATNDDLAWAMNEIEDRQAAIQAEKG